jgi:hypothetical protein
MSLLLLVLTYFRGKYENWEWRRFYPTVQGVAYARADIGGLYRLNSDDGWTPLEDWANDSD